jgi:hypothetical protein
MGNEVEMPDTLFLFVTKLEGYAGGEWKHMDGDQYSYAPNGEAVCRELERAGVKLQDREWFEKYRFTVSGREFSATSGDMVCRDDGILAMAESSS